MADLRASARRGACGSRPTGCGPLFLGSRPGGSTFTGGRAAEEREFGRSKHEWGLLPLRVRALDRVRLHPDLTILSRLAVALAEARAVPLAA